MAVLDQLPSLAIIDGFKGTIDFYLWKGVPCARMWPIHGKRQPYPDEAAGQQAFSYINKAATTLDPFIIDQYKRMAVGTPLTWKDLLVRSYMKGLDY